jgi:hypothetical protein
MAIFLAGFRAFRIVVVRAMVTPSNVSASFSAPRFGSHLRRRFEGGAEGLADST